MSHAFKCLCHPFCWHHSLHGKAAQLSGLRATLWRANVAIVWWPSEINCTPAALRLPRSFTKRKNQPRGLDNARGLKGGWLARNPDFREVSWVAERSTRCCSHGTPSRKCTSAGTKTWSILLLLFSPFGLIVKNSWQKYCLLGVVLQSPALRHRTLSHPSSA